MRPQSSDPVESGTVSDGQRIHKEYDTVIRLMELVDIHLERLAAMLGEQERLSITRSTSDRKIIKKTLAKVLDGKEWLVFT